jgi:hypothetical protein
VFSVGNELTLFMGGIVKGRTINGRIPAIREAIRSGADHRQLNTFLARASTAVREVFGGPVTYASLPFEHVDWDMFDLIGINHYWREPVKDRYLQTLEPLLASGQDAGDPQRDAARGEQGRDVPAEGVGLPGIPAVYFLAFLADRLFLQPVGGDHLAVQDQVRQALLLRRLQDLGQAGCLRGKDLDDLIDVPVGGGLEPLPSRGISGRSRNQASAKTACFPQVSARVPRRVPSSRRWSASRTER